MVKHISMDRGKRVFFARDVWLNFWLLTSTYPSFFLTLGFTCVCMGLLIEKTAIFQKIVRTQLLGASFHHHTDLKTFLAFLNTTVLDAIGIQYDSAN